MFLPPADMAPLRFRAWQRDLRKMFDVASIDMSGGYLHLSSPHEHHCMLFEAEVMQSTGLKDSKGKEIWEGDIVRWKWNARRYGPASVVRFGTLYEGDGHERTGWIVDDCFVDSKCEVIGNRFENPDLLTSPSHDH